MAAAASSWEHQLVFPTIFEDEENVTAAYDWCADPDEYEEEAQEWAEEADAYCGNDDEWDEEFPQDDVDLKEQFRSLETAEAFATTEMENVSSDLKSAARSFMDARKLVAQVKSARGFFASGWEWVLSTVLQSMTPGASAGNKGFWQRKRHCSVKISWSWER